MGFDYYRRQDYRQATIALKAAVSLEPTNYEASLWLGFCYYYLKDFDSAAAAFRTASRIKPNDVVAQNWLGDILYTLRRYGEAAAAFKSSLNMETNQPRAWFDLGCCQYYQKAYESAAHSFLQCAVVEPTNYLARIWEGYSFVQLGRYDPAAAAFEQAEMLRPNDYDANLWRGMSLLRLSRFAEAIPNLEGALASKPRARTVRWLLFFSYLATGQVKKISGLHLGFVVPLSIVLLGAYLSALGLLFRKSLRPETRSAPGIGFTLAWCMVMIVGQALFVLAPWLFFSWPISRAIGLGVSLSALPLIAAALFGFARQPWGEPFAWPPRNPGGKLVLAAFATLGGVVLLEGGYGWLVQQISGKPIADQMMNSWLGGGTRATRCLAFLAVAIVAPAAEEILFRGLLFGAIGKWLSSRWAIIITAGLFGLAHLQPIYFLPIFAVGLVLGWARHKSGGLALPFVLHCANNGGALLIIMAIQLNR